MAKSADLNDEVLVDSFVPKLIDKLRRRLHPKFGVRAYKLSLVRRVWSGDMIGEGTMTEEVTEFDPQPKIAYGWSSYGVMKVNQEPCGTDIEGDIEVTELSLQYSEEDLGYGNPEQNTEYFFKLEDAHGQKSETKYFVHRRPPYIDREKDFGWVLVLKNSKV